MNLKEAQSTFESQFKTVVRGGVSARAPNGEPYICVTGGGIKPEGEPFPVKFAFEELAAKWWLNAANEIADGKLNTLYWRHEPEWELEKRGKGPIGANHTYGIVYSRFVTE
jgi:hypothetical protein